MRSHLYLALFPRVTTDIHLKDPAKKRSPRKGYDHFREENRKTLHENLNKLDIFSRKESNWWPFYAHYTNLSLDTWESDIIKSDNFLNECKDKIEKLLLAMEGINF